MGIFQTIKNKYKDVMQNYHNKNEFKQALFCAVKDGKFTKEEIEKLDKMKNEFGLTDEDINGMKVEIFTAAYLVAKEDKQVTENEEKELKDIQKYLGIADDEIQTTKKELARFRLLNEIQKGNLPNVPIVNLVTQKGEEVYWVEPAILAEEKIIRRNYEGGSHGVSLRIMKGVSYRVSGHRGHIVNETGLVPVSDGELVITKKRIIFRGDGKSFTINLNKILDIQIFSNGIHLSDNNKSKPRLIKFKQEGNHDIVGAIMSYAVNHYGDKEKDEDKK